jgi:FkbM family methyltransferase
MNPKLPLPLNTFDIGLNSKPKSKFLQKTLQINNDPLHFVHIENDDTIYGTLSCLQNDKFHFRDVQFNEGDIIVDIGCNVGLVGLVLSKISPKIKVYSFDASKLAIDCARMSAGLNGLINFEAYNLAIGAVNQANVTFFSNGKDASCLVEDGLNKSNNVPENTVNKIKIDEIFDSPFLGISKVKYLKMDIEGGEFEIFDRLFTHRPDILDRIEYLHIEIHPYQEFHPIELENKIKAKWGNKVFFDV